MNTLILYGCTPTPLGAYLKGLAVLRLVAEQADAEARASWDGDAFILTSSLDEDQLIRFFLDRYAPTPILAPWNGGSGFYEKDRKIGVEAIANCEKVRFAEYRRSIEIVRALPEVQIGKLAKTEEDARRESILLHCRNLLPDSAVDWLDAAIGISAEGKRAFAPILGTGGNEGRLDYTNNFMERVAALLISPGKNTPVEALLRHALFGTKTSGLQLAASGQFDPGRAGGANQGQGISAEGGSNPWDFVLTLEGAVAWAGGIYRRQGISYRSFLCSPFTVFPSKVGYGSSLQNEEAKAEIWAPLWQRPARHAEIRGLLREGRASIQGSPAKNGLQFAQAVASLGIDRGIERFVRFSLLKRRGDSFVALPAGIFPAAYRGSSDFVRQLSPLLEELDRRGIPASAQAARRGLDAAIYEVLLRDNADRMREMVARLGRLLRILVTKKDGEFPQASLGEASEWLGACASNESVECRIGAALASIYDSRFGSVREHLAASSKVFAWSGLSLADRMVSVLERRLQLQATRTRPESEQGSGTVENAAVSNALASGLEVDAGDATLFVEGAVSDDGIEDFLFAFCCLRGWQKVDREAVVSAQETVEVMPIYALMKHMFLPRPIRIGGEDLVTVKPDKLAFGLLRAGAVSRAAERAVQRLRGARMRPIVVPHYFDGDTTRLAGAMLIPVRTCTRFHETVLHPES